MNVDPGTTGSEFPDYRPVSRLAVTAAGLGVCSAAALLHPLCWAVPLAGVAVSAAALADVRRHGRAGGVAALVGLALAAGFGGQAAGHATVQRLLAERRAVTAARMWIDAVREDRRADAAAMSGGTAADMTAVADAVQALQACGPTGTVTGIRAAPDSGSPDEWIVSLRLLPCGTGGAIGVQMRLGVMAIPRRGGERWLVTDVAVAR